MLKTYSICLAFTVVLSRLVNSEDLGDFPPAGHGFQPQSDHRHDSHRHRDSQQVTEAPLFTATESQETVTPAHVVSSCKAFIEAFGDAFSGFTKCMISYARPLRFCEHCVKNYTKAKAEYEVLMEGTTPDDQGSQCGDMILNSDRVQLIVKGASFMEDMWKDCSCDNCFEYYQDINGTVYDQLNNRTSHFLHKVEEVQECFKNHSQGTITPLTANITNSSVCRDCLDVYKDLNKLYEEIQEHYNGKACMDVVDVMNYTRMMWSRDYHCHQQKGDVVAVLVVSVLFCIMPIIFYLGNKIHGTKTQSKIVKQKRLRDVTGSMTEPLS